MKKRNNKIFMQSITISILALSVFIPTIAKADVPQLNKPQLPDLNFKRPANMPDINIDLSTEYNSLMGDLKDKGFGQYNLNLKDKEMDKNFANQGLANKLSDKKLDSYLDDAKNKYLPQINASKDASSKLDYKPIDLSSKWDLMSKTEAEKMLTTLPEYRQAQQTGSLQSGSLPSYDSIKSNLQSTAYIKPLPPVNHTPPAEFNQIKLQVINDKANLKPDLSHFDPSDLPIGINFDPNGKFVDKRPARLSANQTLNGMKNSGQHDEELEALDRQYWQQYGGGRGGAAYPGYGKWTGSPYNK